MKLSEKIKEFFTVAKDKIEVLENFQSLDNTEKKERLDEAVTKYAKDAMDTLGLNIVLRWAIKKLIIDNIPTITQAIFDLLKARADGVTK